MKNKIIHHKGYEILHRHVFNWVWFDAWKGNNKLNKREIRDDNRFIDWDNPLSDEAKDFLIGINK